MSATSMQTVLYCSDYCADTTVCLCWFL